MFLNYSSDSDSPPMILIFSFASPIASTAKSTLRPTASKMIENRGHKKNIQHPVKHLKFWTSVSPTLVTCQRRRAYPTDILKTHPYFTPKPLIPWQYCMWLRCMLDPSDINILQGDKKIEPQEVTLSTLSKEWKLTTVVSCDAPSVVSRKFTQ